MVSQKTEIRSSDNRCRSNIDQAKTGSGGTVAFGLGLLSRLAGAWRACYRRYGSRVEEHLRKGSLSLTELDTLVPDEAGRMLDMGFQAALEAIIGESPSARQTLLFSATYAEGIRPIGERLMREPVMVEVASTHDSSSIRQHFHRVVDEPARFEALCRLLLTYCPLPRVQRGILQHQARDPGIPWASTASVP